MKVTKKIIAIILAIMTMTTALSIGASAVVRNLDLAFVIDTTASMDDDIYTVKQNMKTYFEDLKETGMNFRIAIIDYRDFASRTGDDEDYPYSIQLDFTSDYDAITRGINDLDTGYGGDVDETLCSALIDGVDKLSWRDSAGKAIIVMGDAPALDPEPITGYTKAQAVSKLKYDSLAYTEELMTESTDLVLESQAGKRSSITVFAIATSSNSEVISDFQYISEKTGGKCYNAYDSEDISDSIEEIIQLVPETVKEPTFWDKVKNFFLKIWDFLVTVWETITSFVF